MASCLSDLAQRVEVIPGRFTVTQAVNIVYEAYNKKVGADNGRCVPQRHRSANLDSVCSSIWLFRRRRDRGIPDSQLHFCPIGDTFPLGPSALCWGGIGLGAWGGYPHSAWDPWDRRVVGCKRQCCLFVPRPFGDRWAGGCK